MSVSETPEKALEERIEGTEDDRPGTMRGGHDPRELARLSVEARRERAAQRAHEREDARRTVRERLALALSSELTVEDWRDVAKALSKKAKAGDEKSIHALARLADQAFGKSTGEVDAPADDATPFASLSPGQRAAMMAKLRDDLLAVEATYAGEDEEGAGTPDTQNAEI